MSFIPVSNFTKENPRQTRASDKIVKSSNMAIGEEGATPAPTRPNFFSFLTRKKSSDLPEKPIEVTAQETEQDDAHHSQNSLHASQSTGVSSINTKYPNAREVSETYSTVLFEMRWCFVSLIVNSVLLYFIKLMSYGVQLGVSKDIATTFACVIVEVLLLLTNIVTFLALNDGAAAYFGCRLTPSMKLYLAKIVDKKGYSMAVCGFHQQGALAKFSYCNNLSLNSTCRDFLSKISVIWFLLELSTVLTPIAATSLQKSYVRADFGVVNCLVYEQTNAPVDRKWPNFDTQAGVAELVFGSSLGILRSESTDPSVVNTTSFIPPQILQIVTSGNSITGPGFMTTIFSKCACTGGSTVPFLTSLAPQLTNQTAATLLANYNMLGVVGIANRLDFDGTTLTATTLLARTAFCGGASPDYILLCTTTFSDHYFATVSQVYTQDGMDSTITQNAAALVATGAKADMKWVYQAVKNMMEGDDASFSLPPTIPGLINPLLWWTTSDLLSINPSLIDAGIETFWTILLRAGIQRTYSSRGHSCTKNQVFDQSSQISINNYGFYSAVVFLVFQILVTLLSFVAFVPWMMSKSPIGPGVRALKDSIYFTTLLCSTSIDSGFHELCNSPTHELWQALDINARVGESIQTMSEDVGHVTMDKPKLISGLLNGKRYY